MGLTNAEKLLAGLLVEVLENQQLILEEMKLKRSGANLALIKDALSLGAEWSILDHSALPVEWNHAVMPADVAEVYNHLEMWRRIQEDIAKLSVAEQASLTVQVPQKSFSGFDPHEGKHYHHARFIVDHVNDFSCFKNHSTKMNSHSPVLQRYQAMYAAYAPLRAQIGQGNFTLTQLIQLLT